MTKTLQYCKVISLQLIKINGGEKKAHCLAGFSRFSKPLSICSFLYREKVQWPGVGLSLWVSAFLAPHSGFEGPPRHELSCVKQGLERCTEVTRVTELWLMWMDTISSNRSSWTLLVVPCSWTHLPAQGMQVQSLLQEDPTCHGATKLVPQLISLWSRAQELQLLKLLPLDPVLHKRSHCNEKPAHHKEKRPQLRN